MSVHQQALVWGLDLPHNQAWVLMALADHAHADGTECFPGVRLVAWQTGYGERQVRRILHDLRGDGIIEAVAYAAGGTRPTKYVLHLDRGVSKEPLSDANNTPVRKSEAPGVAVRPPDTTKTDEPSVTIIEPSEEPSLKGTFGFEDGLFRTEWITTLRAIDGWKIKGEPHVATLWPWVIEKGWTEQQLEASAIGLASCSDKTLKGYRDMAAAFRRRLNQGYDDPGRHADNGRGTRGISATAGGPDSGRGGGWDNRGG